MISVYIKFDSCPSRITIILSMKRKIADFKKIKPTSSDLKSMWKDLKFEDKNVSWKNYVYFQKMNPYLNTDEGIVLKCFVYSENKTFDDLVEIVDYNSSDFTPHFLKNLVSSTSINKNLSDSLGTIFPDKASTILIDQIYIDAKLADRIYYSGTYEWFSNENTISASKELAIDFCGEIFNNRYDDIVCLYSTDPWAEWFQAEIADGTFIIIDKDKRLIWLICLTDSA